MIYSETQVVLFDIFPEYHRNSTRRIIRESNVTHGPTKFTSQPEREKNRFPAPSPATEREKNVEELKHSKGKAFSFVGRTRSAKMLRHFAAVSRDDIR